VPMTADLPMGGYDLTNAATWYGKAGSDMLVTPNDDANAVVVRGGLSGSTYTEWRGSGHPCQADSILNYIGIAGNYYLYAAGTSALNYCSASEMWSFNDRAVTNIADEAYGAGWNADTGPPTKNGVYDQMELRAVKTVVNTQAWSAAQIDAAFVTNNETGLTLGGDFTNTGTLDGNEGAAFCLVAGDTITGTLLLDDDAGIRMDATANGMADDKFNGVTMTGKLTAEAITQWDAVYLTSSGTWGIADADAAGKFPSWGIATATIGTGTNLVVLTQGVIRNDAWAWSTNGAPLYLSDTAGGLSQTPPGTSTDCVQLIGKVLSDDEAYINTGSMVYGLVK